MPKIRVLIVDDAVVFRRLVAEELGRDPALDVVGTAANGRIALAKLAQLNPDLVMLDVEMPEMDGLATLKELRKTYPRLPVIMFSALTDRGAEATLDALALGATDYFTKPTNAGGLDASLEVIREQLIPKIKALCASAGNRAPAAGRANIVASPSTTGAPGGAPGPHHFGSGRCPRHRNIHRRAECSRRNLATAACRFSGAHRDRAAHASHVHAAPGRTAVRRVRDPGAGGNFGDDPASRKSLDCPGRLPHDHRAGGPTNAPAAASGPSGKLLPTRGRRPAPLGGEGVRPQLLDSHPDRHGARRSARLRISPGGRWTDPGARRSHLRCLGNAGKRGAGRTRRPGAAAVSHRE